MCIINMGCELEGCHNTKQTDSLFRTDGSLEFDFDHTDDCYYDGELRCEGNCSYEYVGEMISKPLPISELLIWIKKNYPVYHNKSCGGHIHLSFKNKLEYMKFCDVKFYNFFKAKMKEWGIKNHIKAGSQFYKRLAGNNTYCHDKFYCTQQIHNNGDRYCILNYCWRKHRTIEVRLLPIFDKMELYLSAVNEIYDIFNMWLIQSKREKRFSLNTKIYTKSNKENKIICV